MHILIDKSQWRMVAAAATRKWANLAKYVDFEDRPEIFVVDSQEARTWSVIGSHHMTVLYMNMSGQDEAPEYGECISQLSAYAETWPQYHKSETQLEREAEAIYAAEQEGKDEEDLRHEAKVALAQQCEAHQAAIQAAEASKGEPSSPSAAQPAKPAETKPKAKADGEPAPRQGITKRIWEIADQLLAVTGKIDNLKEFRRQVIERAQAEGANGGTAATQFGRWKAHKGL